MARLTASQVRLRAAVIVALTVVTIALVLLGMVYAGGNAWFLFLVLIIDLPAMVILLVAERLEQTRS